jgi:hypothetical protein
MNINQQHDHSRTFLSYTRAVPDLIPYRRRANTLSDQPFNYQSQQHQLSFYTFVSFELCMHDAFLRTLRNLSDTGSTLDEHNFLCRHASGATLNDDTFERHQTCEDLTSTLLIVRHVGTVQSQLHEAVPYGVFMKMIISIGYVRDTQSF